MKYIAQSICFLSLLILFDANSAFGTVFTATTSGDWSSSATWGGTAPGLIINSNDEIIIPDTITVTLDQDVEINGLLTINGGLLNLADYHLTIAGDYVTTLGGALNVTANSDLSVKGLGKTSPVEFVNASDSLRKLHVDVEEEFLGSHNVAFNSDIHVLDSLIFSHGYINIDDQNFGVYGDMHLGDTATFEANQQSNLWLKTDGQITGELHFQRADTFHVELTGQDSLVLAWTGRVYGNLTLNQGRVILENRHFVLEEGATITGGSPSSYIQTNGTNDFRAKMNAGDSAFYPIGTASGYNPASLKLNPSTSDGNYGIRVIDNVYGDSLSGNDLSDSSKVVDQTWVTNTYGISGNIDVNLSTYWEAQDEVNGFNRDSCFISHYTNGWDQSTYVQATTASNGMFTVTRDSITNLSPFAVFSESTAQLFIAQSSGKWSNGSNWSGGTSPGGTIGGGVQVMIPSGISIELDQDIEVAGSNSTLEVGGELINDNQKVTITEGTLTGSGNVDIHTLHLQSNAVLAFAGDLTVNNLYGQNTLIDIAATTAVEDTLSCWNVSLEINAGTQLTLQDNVTFIIDNSSISNHSISIAGNGSVNLIFRGDGKVTTGELGIGTINDVTVDLNSTSDRLILTQNLIVQGILNVKNGIIDLNDNGMSLRSDLQMSANGYLMATENSSMSLKTNTSLTSPVKFHGGADTLNGLTIEVGGGNEAKFDSDATINGTFNLRNGTMNIQGQTLAVNGNLNAQTDGELSTDNQTNLWLTSSGNVSGAINFNTSNNTVGNLVVNLGSSDSVSIGSDVMVDGTLQLENGNIAIGANNLMISANANVEGGSPDSYVLTSGKGKLGMSLVASDTAAYHVGTAEGYAKAWLKLNSGSSDGSYMVNVQNNVWAQGITGTDISTSESVVDHTWDITTDASGSVDVDLALTWEGAAEVNSFDNQNCYISHYADGSWDATATASATANAYGTFTITRDNVTSLSPFAVFDENTSVGIEDQVEVVNHIDLYPNPAENTLHISSNLKEPTMIRIYSVDGRLVQQATLQQGDSQLNISNMGKGTYYLHLTEADAGITFIKQ